jgi:hypothetical protein
LDFSLVDFQSDLFFLLFFSSKKKTKFAYGPNDRVLKNINDKPIQFSENVRSTIEIFQIDTLAIYDILRNGNVNFNESNTRLDSCKLYTIQSDDLKLKVENCDKAAVIISLKSID